MFNKKIWRSTINKLKKIKLSVSDCNSSILNSHAFLWNVMGVLETRGDACLEMKVVADLSTNVKRRTRRYM